jgi:hypothetical protein
MQGIVMEQEELSDSDEDNQHVEFECEEMDDSEEEQVQGPEASPIQNKVMFASTSVSIIVLDPSMELYHERFLKVFNLIVK